MAQYGVAITWTPTNSAQQVQVLRAPDDGTGSPSTGSEAVRATVEPGIEQYVDFLPNDNTLRHYRVRHVTDNLGPGTASVYVRAKPRVIPRFSEPPTQTV